MVAFSPDARSNLMGTKFTVYDHGVSPVKAQGLVEKAHTRQELAAICYVSAVVCFLPSSTAAIPSPFSSHVFMFGIVFSIHLSFNCL
jgi:hypothetical protein